MRLPVKAPAKGAITFAMNPPTEIPMFEIVAESFSNDSEEVFAEVSMSLNF